MKIVALDSVITLLTGAIVAKRQENNSLERECAHENQPLDH